MQWARQPTDAGVWTAGCCSHLLCLQDEMEAILSKASKQAISAIMQMAEVVASSSSRRICSAPMTRMICPQLWLTLEAVTSCVQSIPVLIERTMQLGRENEFFFEVGFLMKRSKACTSTVLLLMQCLCACHASLQAHVMCQPVALSMPYSAWAAGVGEEASSVE